MAASHKYYSSPEFIKRALDANPTYKREIASEAVKQYTLKKQQAKKVPRTRAANTGTRRVSEARRQVPKNFDEADELSTRYFSEMDRMSDK
jgi:hypothetical protein